MLELKNIKKNYLSGENTVYALKGIDLSFRENEFVSILGQSGCGKTTLLNIIGGLDKYTEGDLIINGKSTKEYNNRDWDTYRNHSIGFVFQSYNLIPHQSVLSNVEIALTLSGVSKRERRKRAIQALKDVGLENQIHKRPSEMSGGQMQRVAIARALVNNPDIILADEPTGALDSETSVQVMDILKEVSKDKLVIMVTHNPDLASQYSTRIIRMLDGVIKEDSNPLSDDEKEIYHRKDLLVLEDMKNKKEKKPSMNFFTALKLSLKNLITKKGRTILTSFAGSIGIIGIGLVLAVSQGTTGYINSVQEESLSSYPLSIRKNNTDISALFETFTNPLGDETSSSHKEDKVYEQPVLYNILDGIVNSSSSENDLKSFNEFLVSEIANEESKLHKAVNGVSYSYGINIPIYTESEGDGKIMESDMGKLVNSIFTQYASKGATTNTASNASGTSNSVITSLLESTGSLTLWEEFLPGVNGDPINDLVKQQYDLVYGTWPNSYDEVTVVLNEHGEIPDAALYSLGLKNQDTVQEIINAVLNNTSSPDNKEVEFTYEEICSKEYRTILAGDAYTYNSEKNIYVDNRVTEAGLKVLYNTRGTNLKITGVIKQKDEVNSPMINGSICYTNLLTKKIIESADGTDVVKAQLKNDNVDVFTNLPFKENSYTDEEKRNVFKSYAEGLSASAKKELFIKINSILSEQEKQMAITAGTQGMTREDKENLIIQGYVSSTGASEELVRGYITSLSDEELDKLIASAIVEEAKKQKEEGVRENFKNTPDEQVAAMLDGAIASYTDEQLVLYFNETIEFSSSTYEDNLIKLGKVYLDTPSTINIYTATFANKDIIKEEIERYNKSVDEKKQITYTDLMGVLMSAVNTIINAITYVLIAFVAISLIVSSIMIAIITLISVQERTKEIGILRAIGASKGNVSSMFNAETIIIGFAAGLFGVIICYILIVPINFVIHSLTHISNLSAVLPIGYAGILILISMFLTMISGFIPSRSAAKKDPVVALRTE